MTIPPPELGEQPDHKAYASFGVRFRAMVLDTIILLLCFTGLLILSMIGSDVPGSGRLLVFGTLALVFLYEPLMVWRFGATIGHRRNNLRVVADATAGNPSFLRAGSRYLVKTALGLLSFVTMALTRRHQAVHDRLTGTTVQFRDIARAQPGDIQWEREPLPLAGLPSRTRRTLIIIAYELLLLIVVGAFQSGVVTDACTSRNVCSAGEHATSLLISLAWMAAAAGCLILGWRGRLLGARLEHVALDESALTPQPSNEL